MSRKNRNIYFLLAVLAISTLLAVYVLAIRKDMSDFGVCYQGGQRIRQAETLYRVSDGHMQYKYAPASAVFFAAFALLPYAWAKLLWYFLMIFFVAAAFLTFLKVLPEREKTGLFLGIFSFLILLKFLGRELQLGQVNVLIIGLLAGTLLLLIEKKDLAAGLLWGASLFFKPYALVFLPYFLLKKRFVVLPGSGVILGLGFALPSLFYGPAGNLLVHEEWLETLSQSTPRLVTTYDNASLLAFFKKLISAPESPWPWVLLSIVMGTLAFLFLWLVREGRKDSLSCPEFLEAGFLFVLIPLLSPLGWYYNYFYALPAVMIILDRIDRFSRGIKVAVLINFVLIGGTLREILGQDLFTFYTGSSLVAVNFLFVLCFLSYLRFKRLA